MSKSNKSTEQIATVTAEQTLRARRMAAVQAALYQRRVAEKHAKYEAAAKAYAEQQLALQKQAEFDAALKELHAKFGMSLEPVAPRANSATTNPSAQAIPVNGVLLRPVQAVHAICASNPNATRKQIIELCVQSGINRATAATQYGVYKKGSASQASE